VKSSLSEQISNSPLLWISAALLAGIVLASLVTLQALVWFVLAFLALLVSILLRFLRPQWKLAILLLPGFLFLGAARYQIVQPPTVPTSNLIAYYNETPRRIYVAGILAEPPDIRDTYMNLRIDVTKVDTGEGDRNVSGTLLVRLTNEEDVVYGEHVRVRGFVTTPPENEEFSYRDYLAMQDIHSMMTTNSVTILPDPEANPFWAFMYRIKASMVKRVYLLFPEPEASLLAGILLGMDNNIPAGVQQAFKNTGTAHIVAISGFNIAIIAGIFVTLFSRFFGKKLGAILAILSIIFYTLLVGASASVVRAAIMGTLSIIAAQFGRRNLALTALAASALIMAMLSPFVLWDIGFQLSFAATLGLVLYAQPMQDAVAAFLVHYFPSSSVEKFVGPFSDYFLLTLAAQITTLPITVYHFARLSLVSFIANPVVLPPQPAVMVLSGLAVLLSRVYMPLGQVMAWVAWPFAAYTIRMVEFFNGLPGGVLILGDFSLLAVILFYVFLFGFTFAWTRMKGFFTPAVILSILAALAFLTYRSVLNMPDGRLHVTFLDVGSADGILIKTPSGRFVLVNGGESPSALANQIGRRIPPFNRGLDYLVVASTQENQVAALPRVLEQYRPKSVLWAGKPQASFSSRRLSEWLTTNRIPLEKAKAGTVFDLGDGAQLHILAVSPRGAILSVEMGTFKVVLPIGVDFDSLAGLENGKNLGPATALLLSESGYAPSNPPEWLANLKPEMVILSVAAGDPDGLPSPELVTALEKANLTRTDVNGWIDLSSDGQQVWINVENK
jgi:competence protein ComEC